MDVILEEFLLKNMENNNKYLIIYHSEDNDGCCSSAIIKYYLVNELCAQEKNITLFGANYAILSNVANNGFYYIDKYGCEINLFDFDYLIMTDVSFNDFEMMKVIYDQYGFNFIWIDHHAPIINESIKQKYDILINGVRDPHRSALLNAYKYCYDPFDTEYLNGNAPYILRILSAWDSFTFEQEEIDFEFARRVNMGFTSWFQLKPKIWYEEMKNLLSNKENIYKPYLNRTFNDGSLEADSYDERNEKIIKNFGMSGFSVNGRPAMLLFMSEGTSSLIFKSVSDTYKNGICAKTSPTGNIIISLYNTDRNDHSFHCGTYLHDNYGGGGHEGAAGCTITIEQFTKILTTKTL